MNLIAWLELAGGSLVAGILAGFLGIGGGTVLVPLLVALGIPPVQAVATSTLTIVITATSGSLQNCRMGYFDARRVFLLGLPAIATAQLGVYLADRSVPFLLLSAFGLFLLINVYLFEFRQHLKEGPEGSRSLNPVVARLTTGGAAGVLAGLFGIGGGVIMVPLQMWLLKEPIKVAIQTSLGVIVITAISACVGHALRGNVLWVEGIVLGIGGLVGAQISTRYLPRLPDRVVSLAFRTLLMILSIYVF